MFSALQPLPPLGVTATCKSSISFCVRQCKVLKYTNLPWLYSKIYFSSILDAKDLWDKPMATTTQLLNKFFSLLAFPFLKLNIMKMEREKEKMMKNAFKQYPCLPPLHHFIILMINVKKWTEKTKILQICVLLGAWFYENLYLFSKLASGEFLCHS